MLLRFLLFILIPTAVACGQFKTPTPLPAEQLKVETLSVLKSLEAKPEWLFGSMTCPAAVISARAGRSQYMSEGCKDDPRRCLERCKSEDPSACYALALLTEEYVEPNDLVPQALYLRSCKLGTTSGCTNRASNISETNSEDPESQKCATETFQKTCDQNDPWGCTMLGLALMRGDGRPKGNIEATKALKKACDVSLEKSGPACKNALTLLDQISKEKP